MLDGGDKKPTHKESLKELEREMQRNKESDAWWG
jgi:hypothetical protein